MRHSPTFMGGSDAQQIVYSVTLLRESTHEWYIVYERRNRLEMFLDGTDLSKTVDRHGTEHCHVLSRSSMILAAVLFERQPILVERGPVLTKKG